MNVKQPAVDLALQKYATPVGDLFVAIRHGRMKRCFSRETAIRYLAFFMTTCAFERSGFKQRHPDALVTHPVHGKAWKRGGITEGYYFAHQRTVRRIRRILAKKREIAKWQKDYDAAASNIALLLSQKPY